MLAAIIGSYTAGIKPEITESNVKMLIWSDAKEIPTY